MFFNTQQNLSHIWRENVESLSQCAKTDEFIFCVCHATSFPSNLLPFLLKKAAACVVATNSAVGWWWRNEGNRTWSGKLGFLSWLRFSFVFQQETEVCSLLLFASNLIDLIQILRSYSGRDSLSGTYSRARLVVLVSRVTRLVLDLALQGVQRIVDWPPWRFFVLFVRDFARR